MAAKRSRSTRGKPSSAPPLAPPVAHGGRCVLRSATVGPLPPVNRLLRRMRLEEFLRGALPKEDRRTKLSPSKALLVRELRAAMERQGTESLPLYPEGRACRWPTARRVLDLFAPVQRHTLQHGKRPAEVLVTELTRIQRLLLKLLGLPPKHYGH